MRRLSGALLSVSLSLVVAGCTSTDPRQTTAGSSSPFADCAALTAPPAARPGGVEPGGAAPSGSGPGGVGPTAAVPPARDTPAAEPPHTGRAVAGKGLPDLRLPCFTGGAEVRLSEIRGPAVVNLWGSWCAPCRKELPAFQRLAQASGGRLHVVGVDTRDDRESAGALGADLGLTFSNLEDRDERLRVRLAAPGLPITVFVDDQGRVRHVDTSGALDDNRLRSLVERHLGMTVPS